MDALTTGAVLAVVQNVLESYPANIKSYVTSAIKEADGHAGFQIRLWYASHDEERESTLDSVGSDGGRVAEVSSAEAIVLGEVAQKVSHDFPDSEIVLGKEDAGLFYFYLKFPEED